MRISLLFTLSLFKYWVNTHAEFLDYPEDLVNFMRIYITPLFHEQVYPPISNSPS